MKFYPKPWVTWNNSSIYKFAKIDVCFTFKPWGFLEHKALNNKIGWVIFNLPLAINTNIFLQLQAISRYQRWTSTRTTRWLLQDYIPNNIRLNNRNYYLWTKKIHMVKTMKIILYTKRAVNGLPGRPKNLLPSRCKTQ
jgi:hypothetical protein